MVRVKAITWRARATVLDAADRVRGRSGPLTPPRRLRTGDYSDFDRLGGEFRDLFIRLGGLKPDHAVLDIGCGPGRMAVPLTGWLTGAYRGFDLVADEVAWCQRHITPRHPNFLFERADVRNARYNPTGGALASEYSFPYAAGEFDFAFATSVFTHMLPDDVERYLAELGRVLKPSGRALLTWFLMTDRSRAALPTERFSFATQVGNASVNDPSSPEAAVAYPREWVERALDIAGLRAESVHPGGWCGTPDPPTWQDVMVVSRQSSSTLAGSS